MCFYCPLHYRTCRVIILKYDFFILRRKSHESGFYSAVEDYSFIASYTYIHHRDNIVSDTSQLDNCMLIHYSIPINQYTLPHIVLSDLFLVLDRHNMQNRSPYILWFHH